MLVRHLDLESPPVVQQRQAVGHQRTAGRPRARARCWRRSVRPGLRQARPGRPSPRRRTSGKLQRLREVEHQVGLGPRQHVEIEPAAACSPCPSRGGCASGCHGCRRAALMVRLAEAGSEGEQVGVGLDRVGVAEAVERGLRRAANRPACRSPRRRIARADRASNQNTQSSNAGCGRRAAPALGDHRCAERQAMRRRAPARSGCSRRSARSAPPSPA